VETKVNYAVVGAFVLLLGALLICGILWLAVGMGVKKNMYLYSSIIHESVAGLDLDAPVKYLGVDVGKVSKITIDPINPQQVRLVFSIENNTLIKQNTEAVLKSQGLTGIAYVELSGGTANSPILTAHNTEQYPMIPMKPSLSARLENVLTTVLSNIDHTSTTVNAMFDENNRLAVKHILANTSILLTTMAEQKTDIQHFIADAAATAHGTAKAIPKLNNAIEHITESSDVFAHMSTQLSLTAHEADHVLLNADQGVDQITHKTLPKFDLLLSDMLSLSTSLKRLSEQTETNPNSLIRGVEPVPLGPGEHIHP